MMSGWEMRQGILWMSGATSIIDLRIRCRITYPDFQSSAASMINFSTAYVPLLDSKNAIAAKMLVQYAERFAARSCNRWPCRGKHATWAS